MCLNVFYLKKHVRALLVVITIVGKMTFLEMWPISSKLESIVKRSAVQNVSENLRVLDLRVPMPLV